MDYLLLGAFVAYSAFILCVGVWGYRKKSFESFALAGRKMGTVLATSAFVATFLSAISVIGVSGYASRYGWSAAAFACYGYALGWILLLIASRRLHRSRMTTIPEFLAVRFESRNLRIFAGLTIIFLYSITMIVQLLGIGITMETLIGLNMTWAILMVGGIFVSYTVLGGLVSVVRTDLVQAFLLGVGVVTAAGVVLWETGGTVVWHLRLTCRAFLGAACKALVTSSAGFWCGDWASRPSLITCIASTLAATKRWRGDRSPTGVC